MSNDHPKLRALAERTIALFRQPNPRPYAPSIQEYDLARAVLAALDALGDWASAFPEEAPGEALRTASDRRLAELEEGLDE